MSTAPLPASVLVARTVLGPGDRLADWADRLGSAAAAVPGHLATYVEREQSGGRVTVRVGVTFACAEDLLAWERSPVRHALLAEVADLTDEPPRTFAVDELAQWTPRPPSKLRTTVLIWVALFPIALLMNHLVMPAVGSWPVVVRTLLLTGILVPGVVFGTLPLLTGALVRLRR
ncbi:hypothetical protein [Pseudonocardia sp. NPDC046786]|uniref:hypothetical protein n=1 Tax=Pseudonocardia sp. NPDC046786 TaxID=3155471 RepID=UPI003409A244